MIKSIKKDSPKSSITYPMLMISTDKKTIILASNGGATNVAGMVINSEDSSYQVGHYTTSWSASIFTPFFEEVTLKNEDCEEDNSN